MLRLYHDHNAVCCQKAELTLFEKGVEYEEQIISLFRSEQYSPEYLEINPRGIVPALSHEGQTIIESTLICEYINEAFPGPALMPTTPLEKARVRLWTKLVDDEIHEAGSTLSFCAMFRDRMLNMAQEEQEKRFKNVGNPIREDMYRSAVELGIESPVAFRSIASYEMMTRDLEERLSHGGDWISTEGFSLAEIGLTPYFARIEYLDLHDIWLSDRPLTAKWWARVKSRESFGIVFVEALSSDDISEMKISGVKIRNRVAERREEYLRATR
jgi:glutathione S-transferase